MADPMTTCDACEKPLDKTKGFVMASARVAKMVHLDPEEREAFHNPEDPFDFPADSALRSGGLVEGTFCDYSCAGDFLKRVELPTVEHPRYGVRVVIPDNLGEVYESGDDRKDGNPFAVSNVTVREGE